LQLRPIELGRQRAISPLNHVHHAPVFVRRGRGDILRHFQTSLRTDWSSYRPDQHTHARAANSPIVLPCKRLASRFSLIARSPVSDTCGAPEDAAGSEAVPFQNHGGELMVPPTGGVPGLARTVSWSTWTPDFVTEKRPAGVAEHPARRTGGLLAMLQRGLARKDGPQSLRRASHRLSHKPGNGRDPVPDSCLRSECSKFCRKWFVLCMILFAFKTDEPLRTYLYSTNHGGPPASWLIASFTVPTTVACSRLG
jgi:hypothetical protein